MLQIDGISAHLTIIFDLVGISPTSLGRGNRKFRKYRWYRGQGPSDEEMDRAIEEIQEKAAGN